MSIFHTLKSKLVHHIKRHEFADRAIWRLRHPFALEDMVHRHHDEFLRLQENLKVLADSAWTLRMRIKVRHGIPVKAIFVCHEPALWPMHETIYQAMVEDEKFDPVVVAMPNTQFGRPVDKGMFDYCVKNGIRVVAGYDYHNGEWLDPVSLAPDYVFFQTPYDFFPDRWQTVTITAHAKLCYLDYGATVLRDSGDHPEAFLMHAAHIFEDHDFSKNKLAERLGGRRWYRSGTVKVTGSPKLDYLECWRKSPPQVAAARRTEILWTPRWRTSEGTCHFFTYKDYFVKLCARRKDIRFVFRPHPLTFQNFIKTGEMTPAEVEDFKKGYTETDNMELNESPDYRPVMLTSAILITDMSSMIAEYLPTGKPIIYTHRVDMFSDYAQKLAEGCYWVRNETELEACIQQLLDGQDPLREKRREIVESFFFLPEGGSGKYIKEILRREYLANS